MSLRQTNIRKLSDGDFDVIIIGGGINGAVSAGALAGRGVRTALIDRGDFAGFTSQESSNLAWGGIKYMENMEFPLVYNLCKCRNNLIRSYPSTVQETRFFATVPRGFRWHPLALWMGGWLYWLIGMGFTRIPRYLSLRRIAREEPVVETSHLAGGFEYSDAMFHDNDARFVFSIIRSALDSGCIAANYVESTAISQDAGSGPWRVTARDNISGESFEIRSRVLVNAAGPYVDDQNGLAGQTTEHHHVFSKGVHLLVPRITEQRRVLAFFASDGRLFFVIPMGNRTCVGTTDTRVSEPETSVSEEDRDFILDNVNRYLRLKKPLSRGDIIAERCGVRPLVVRGSGASDETDWLQLSRKHEIEADRERRHISIFGGKLTDCINVGNEVADLVAQMGIPVPYPRYRWYGEPPRQTREEFFHQARLMNLDGYTDPESTEPLSQRLWRRYGVRALELLEAIREDPEDARILIRGTEYIRAEVRLTAHREMVTKLDDFLRRRSKIALVLSEEEIRRAPGLREACDWFFGDQAEAKLREYFGESEAAPRSVA